MAEHDHRDRQGPQQIDVPVPFRRRQLHRSPHLTQHQTTTPVATAARPFPDGTRAKLPERAQSGREARSARQTASGRLTDRLDVTDGFDNAVEAFLGMLRGENTGKAVVRLP
ncbi:hypothetical protein GL263_17485 [Streptomyces durbertensis]|uniref:Uncharacterized protein n=1 Tax=Streptomyces durbertensis TaxID=2448886 RepID=A0ABR6EJ27_9ACTN|nr:hypothetical protein [Streptomyces durbertensis]